MDEFIVLDYPLGLISDVHKNVEAVKQAIRNHPEVAKWVCLGDIADFVNREGNSQVLADYWPLGIPTVLGNHDMVLGKFYKDELSQYDIICLNALPRAIRVRLSDFDVDCYHSKPKDLWSFVHATYTEREFFDDYPMPGRTKYVAIGHNHEQWKLVFPYAEADLLSVGSIGLAGHFVLVHKDKVTFHKLTRNPDLSSAVSSASAGSSPPELSGTGAVSAAPQS